MRTVYDDPVQSNKYTVTGNESQLDKLSCLIKRIYKGHSAEEVDCMWLQLLQTLESNCDKCLNLDQTCSSSWSSSTAVLITYADGVGSTGKSSLKLLNTIIDNYLGNLAPIIHLLPFLSSTSDGGFAVSSFEKIDPRFGCWEDLKELSKKHNLMADLVLNHVSASHPWVQQFMNELEPGKNYILNPSIDLNWKNVIRPRNTSLFTSIATKGGKKDVWTTFGPDQIDINWQNPNILLEFLNLIVRYINHGVTWIRLDAIGFIWKEPSTTCLHREEVHDIVRALRILLNKLNCSGVLITETNVPEKENISYLKTGDEAHLAYNFPLPPLLLESIINNKADLLNSWLSSWPKLPINTGFLNFTASHDGIGLRALEGLMKPSRVHDLLIACEQRGGLVSHRRMPNGEDKPYELNISWWSAMANTGKNRTQFQFERFILSQLFVMALKGVPAFYLQAIMASENDLNTFYKTGERRDLNRERFCSENLINDLEDQNSSSSKIIHILKHAMSIRSKLKAFDPEEDMICKSKFSREIVTLSRGKNDYRVWTVHNMTNRKLTFCIDKSLDVDLKNGYYWSDVLNKTNYLNNQIELEPYSVHWLIQTK